MMPEIEENNADVDGVVQTKKSLPWKRITRYAVSFLGVLLLVGMSLEVGGTFVSGGLMCPDICWLLKFGEIILAKGIPQVDPFTFTLQAAGQTHVPFVLYSWLSEVLFYTCLAQFNIEGLVIAAAWITVIAFISIPLRATDKLPRAWVYPAIAVSCAAGLIRWNIRPEIFTTLGLSICLLLLQNLRGRSVTDSARTDWKSVSIFGFVIAIWANLHPGFVIALAVTLIYAAGFLLQDKLNKSIVSGKTKTAIATLIIGTIATLLNPYGIFLWSYLPTLFRTPFVARVDEAMPLSTDLFLNTHFWPFIILIILCIGMMAGCIVKSWQKKQSSNKGVDLNQWCSLTLIVISIGATLFARRMIAISSIIILFETANVLSKFVGSSPPGFWRKPVSLVLDLAFLAGSAFAINNMMTKHVSLTIPSKSDQFVPPMSGLRNFSRFYRHGRIFASLPIADMIDLYIIPNSSLFIDSRLDSYTKDELSDYLIIQSGTPASLKMLDSKNIDWVVVQPQERLAGTLGKNPDWYLPYKDRTLRIYRRSKAN